MPETGDDAKTRGRLQARVALVTGAGQGIGLATARLCASEGARVVVAAQHELSAREAAESIPGSLAVWGDVGQSSDVDGLVHQVIQRFDRLDAVIHCAGFFYRRAVLDTPVDEWENVIRTNLTGSFLVARAAAGVMRDGGDIVLLSSMWAERGGYGRAAYCASKAGVDALARVSAAEWAPQSIRVYAVAPGWVRTERNVRLMQEGRMSAERMEALAPTRALIEPDEVAELCVTLASGTHPMLAGTTVHLDGGLTGWLGTV